MPLSTLPRLPRQEFTIQWKWRQDLDGPMLTDRYLATTVPRVINKFMAVMRAEYSNAQRDIVILGVLPEDS
jgi:hypothetical protein